MMTHAHTNGGGGAARFSCDPRQFPTPTAHDTMASGAATADASAPFVFRRVPPEEVRAMDFDPVDDTTRGQAQRIIDEVRSGGEAGLLSVATRFGDIKEGASSASFRAQSRVDQPRRRRVSGV